MSTLRQKFFKRKYIFSALLIVAVTSGLYGCLMQRGAHSASAENGSPPLVPGQGVAIYAAGDIADCRNFKPEDSKAAKTAELIAAELVKDKNAAVLTLGDNTYPVGLPIEFNNCYDATWGRFKERTYPSPGNHDYYTPAAIGYYGYFGALAGPERRGYYSVEIGQWHVVSLNSNLKDDEQKKQMAWLKADLAQHKTRCTLAYWHHPVYSSGGHGNNAVMKEAWKILYEAGTEVVLVSHDHDYERFAPLNSAGKQDEERGIREFVVGTGGAKTTPLALRKPNSDVSDNSSNGVLKMVLKETGYEWEFLPVAGDSFSDRGAALCH